jgi:hypothetical protein
MRRSAALLLAGLAVPAASAGLAACGGGSGDGARARPGVRLVLSAPGDRAVVHGTSVDISGRVAPARARVEIVGVEAPTRADGRFDLRVPLTEGANVLDVSASARGRRPALTALRVTRDTRVTVPTLAGSDPDAASAALERLHLRVTQIRDGGLLDHLIPSAIRVCGTEPGAGARLLPGRAVRLHVARRCSAA